MGNENQQNQEVQNTSLTPQQQNAKNLKLEGFGFPSIAELETVQTLAKVFFNSGALPKSLDSAPKIVMAIEAGREVGIPPIQAMNSFYIVNGSINIFGMTAIELVVKAGHTVDWGECDDTKAEVTITRGDNKKSMTGKFTMEMAVERGLTGKGGPWKTAPDNMLKFKAFHSIAKFLVPDALKGLPIKEIQETEYIEGEVAEENKNFTKAADPAKPGEDKTVETVTETEHGSLNEALDKEPEVVEEMPKEDKRLKADIIKDIEAMAKEKKHSIDDVCKKFKKPNIDRFTVKELLTIEEALKQAPVKEDKPAAPAQPTSAPAQNKGWAPPERENEGPAAKAMRAAQQKKQEEAVEPGSDGKWPEDVCRYLRFVDGINDEDLLQDIIQLKADAKTGIFKGYDAYPNLRDQIKTLPADFQ